MSDTLHTPTDTVEAPTAEPSIWPDNALQIDSMDMDAQGVAHKSDGKVVFVEGALAGEVVTANIHRKKKSFETGTLVHILKESSQRVTPNCKHFGLHTGACGGCKMQHLAPAAQLAVKQRVLEDNLWHLGKVTAERILRPMQGPDWGYRWRGRLAVRNVIKKGIVLVGFHERKSRYIADMDSCAILPPHVSDLLVPLRGLIASMDARDTCAQIELACGEGVTALVLRHLEPLNEADIERLHAFAREHAGIGLQWWLQPKGPNTVHRIDDAQNPTPELAYTLPAYGIRMPFKPTDFTQVNPYINRALVSRALQLLDVQKDERVIDWFCGLGNFTLPLTTQAKEVLGIEGSDALVERANANYAANQAARNGSAPLAPVAFVARNLFEMTPEMLIADGNAQKWLVDPPREGALALSKALAAIHQARIGAEDAPELPPEAANWQPPQRIVYVSCNPATLARDAGHLVNEAGYRCVAAGIINMFPHTAHVESIAVFERVSVPEQA